MADKMDEIARRARLARGAVRQAERHDRAVELCLAELDGLGSPSRPMAAFLLGRAWRHASRAQALVKLANWINQDPGAAPLLAASLERQDRTTLRVTSWRSSLANVDQPDW